MRASGIHIRTVAIMLFVALLATPLVLFIRGSVDPTPLLGARYAYDWDAPEFGTVYEGTWQSHITHVIEQSFPYRGYIVRLANTIHLMLLGELMQNPHAPVVLGKADMLYEQGYLDHAVGVYPVADEVIQNEAKQLYALQKRAEEAGVYFLVMIAPSKVSVYPEFVPYAYASSLGAQTQKRQALLRALDLYDVHYLDGVAFTRAVKERSAYPVFARGGTYWNYVVACEVASWIAQDMVNQGYTASLLDCSDHMLSSVPLHNDRNILDVINLASETTFLEPMPYPLPKRLGDARPRLLFVGDSFLWQPLAMFDQAGWYGVRDFYYFQKNASFPEGTFEPISYESLELTRLLAQNNGIIIEASETAIGQIGYGFLEAVLAE
jgi:hypothetical protein